MPAPSRSALVTYGAIALVVLVLGLRWLGRDAAAGGTPAPAAAGHGPTAASAAGDPAQRAARAGSATLERAPAAVLVIHVAGAVRRPGVYRLRDGSRVADAVARAGGAAHGADQAAVNLAAKVVDGQQVLLPRRAAAATTGTPAATTGTPAAAATSPATGAAGAATPGAAAAAPISLASATLEQLDTLDGVGPVTAQKILDWRTKSGGFRSVDDLAQIPGIGPKKLESLRSQVVP